LQFLPSEADNIMSRTPTFKFADGQGENRLRELILYISVQCQDDPKFGATKLNKILWWADFLSYAERRTPITGIEYQRLGNGPAPRRLVPVRNDMAASGEIAISEVQGPGGYIQKKIVPLRAPDLGVFSAADIAVVDRVIRVLWRRTASGVSRLSHGKAWEVAADGASIPYEAVFLSDDMINRYDVARTKELARQFGWTLA
jgi:Protein of unknown function (DUF4065)